MKELFEHVWIRYTVFTLIVIIVLTLFAVFLAAFESEHYTNSRFRAGKKISFKQALRNNLIGLYTALLLIALSWYGILQLYRQLELVPRILVWIGIPLLSAGAAIMNAKNEKYMFLKLKDFSEGFLTVFTILMIMMGGIGYYLTFFH